MGNRIFETVLNRKIEIFASTFIEDSASIFFEENKLIHPGEYGKYRENSLKELLRHITKHKVSDGFIITPDDKVSTQIDIVIFKNDEAPILEKNYIDFFSVESVIAIGEVKSTLDRTAFIDTIRKLATNKQLHQSRKGKCLKKEYNGPEHDEIISFLVCKTTSFDISTLNFDEIYIGIEQKYRHNFILDLDKGLIGYEFPFKNLNADDTNVFVQNKGNIDATVWYEYPNLTFNNNLYKCKDIYHPIQTDKKYNHIHLFLTKLTQTIEYKNLYSTELLNYLNLPTVPTFNK